MSNKENAQIWRPEQSHNEETGTGDTQETSESSPVSLKQLFQELEKQVQKDIDELEEFLNKSRWKGPENA